MKSIQALRVNHINLVVEDFERSVTHFRNLYDAELLIDLPQPEVHACLIEIGRVIFEIFAPRAFLFNARYGPHYLGIEYQADIEEVREVLAAHGVRIARDAGVALHTHPADCFGVSFEFYAGEFHDQHWELLGRQIRSPGYWRDDHPLGLTGLKGCTMAVADIEAASQFLQSLLGAKAVYETTRPALSARGIGLQLADAIIELLTPVDDGELARHLNRFGDGIRSTVFGARDIDQTRQYFLEREVQLAPAVDPAGFAVFAGANDGFIFEFISGQDPSM